MKTIRRPHLNRDRKARHYTLISLLLLNASLQQLTATIMVTSLADSGPGSLRDVVASSLPGDTIQFAVKGLISLNSAINITHDLAVQGPGPSALTIDPHLVDRAFITSGGTVTLSGMTISHGLVFPPKAPNGGVGQSGAPGIDSRGGAILNLGSSSILVLSNCWLVGNGIQGGEGGDGGPVPVGAAGKPGDGGLGGEAIGGAVHSDGNVLLLNCTFSDNRAIGGAGGVGGTNANPVVPQPGGTGGNAGEGNGGAIHVALGAIVTFTNCTFSGNLARGGVGGLGGDSAGGLGGQGGNGGGAGGGAIAVEFNITLYSCTIVSNSAYGEMGGSAGNGLAPGANGSQGIGAAGGVIGYAITCQSDIANTILADNFANTLFPNYSIAMIDDGYCFFGTEDFPTFCGFAPTSQWGTINAPLHPQLGPLAQNGSGLPTHATTLTSPVTDAGYSFGSTTDQRGAPRPYTFPLLIEPAGGDGTDIGAFELGSSDLALDVISNNVVISWPAYYGDLTVEATANLASGAWSNILASPFVLGNRLVVTNRITDPMRFYRLVNR